MPYVQIEQDVWVEPSDILIDLNDDDLIAELKARGYNTVVLTKVRQESSYVGPENKAEINLERLYELKRINSPAFDQAFRDYIWQMIGKVV